MKILSLSIVGSKRLLMSGTREIHYTPKSDIQLLIGNNGSGKSTLLQELSPLPAINGEYQRGGHKEIIIQHNGFYYKLRSEFLKGQEHFFLKASTLEGLVESAELNDGHTLTIQKHLVEQEFRYTNEIHDLLLGNIKLTTLSPQKRKEWFVRLCDVDVSYAVQVYQRLQVAARNIVGARKHTEQKLFDETSKLLNEAELSELKDKIQSLTKESRALAEFKNHGVKFTNEDERQLTSVQNELSLLSEHVIKIATLDLKGTTSVSEYQTLVNEKKSLWYSTKERLDGFKREYESVEELISLMVNNDGKSIEDLRGELTALDSIISDSTVPVELVQRQDLKAVLSDLTQLIDVFDDVLYNLPINTDMGIYNKARFAKAEDSYKESTTQVDQLLFKIDKLSNRLSDLENHSPTQCPECNHKWIPGVSENEVERIKETIPKYVTELDNAKAKRKQVSDWLEAANTWKEAFARYNAYVREYPRLKWVWDYFTEDNRIFNRPSSLVGYMRNQIPQLNAALSVVNAIERKDLLLTAIAHREQLEGKNGKVLSEKAAYLETQIHNQLNLMQSLQKEYDDAKAVEETLVFVTNSERTLRDLNNRLGELFILKDKYRKNLMLDEKIDENHLLLSGLSTRLNDALGKENVVKHLEQSLSELTLAEQDYKVLLQSLSPSEGLIADSLLGFINTVTEQMNFIIKQIWTTKLRVLPCSTDKGELDYRFPLDFGLDNKVIDVALGSKGQKELVDFVFVLISMIYLDLQHYPLLLDEVGHSFHDANRVRLFDYIKRLMEAGQAEQVFVVSHFSNTHGSLTRADVNILDRTGVMVTPDSNKHIKIL